MSELTTAARPYAKAVHELAAAAGTQDKWSAMLAFMAAVVEDEAMAAAIARPDMEKGKLEELFLAVCSDQLDEQGKNFARLLVENHRLVLVPQIAALFEIMKRESEGKVQARVVCAQELTEEQKSTIAESLGKRLGKDVEVETEIDAALLGGAIVYAGDLVIDGSISGRLKGLSAAMG